MGFRSRDEKVQVTLTDDNGREGNFWLKRYLSKRDLNNSFIEVIEQVQRYRTNKEESPVVVEEKESEEKEAKKASPITLSMILDMPEGEMSILRKSILAWDLTDEDGEAVLLSDEEVDGLTIDVHDQLITKIKEFNKMLTTEELQDLDLKSSDTSTPPPTSPLL